MVVLSFLKLYFILFFDLTFYLILCFCVLFEAFYLTSFYFLAPGHCLFPKNSLNILLNQLFCYMEES